ILKVAFCAGLMTFFTKSRFKEIANVWHVVFVIIYATSGFAIQYYTSIYYLDIVILFPLIIYALEELFDNDKKIGFVITMAIGFILSLYLMYMVCFFLLLFSFVRVREMPLEKRQIKVAQLGLSVLIAGCLSAFVSVPSTIQLLSSQRATVAQNLSEISILSAYLDMFFGNKLFMLYGVELPLAYIIIKILLDRETVKSNLGYLLLGVMLVIPIKFEYINLAWHPGGYVQFPMRYGYMITFWFVYLMARILASSAEIEWKSSRTQKVMYYLRLLTYAAVPFVAFVIFNYFQLFREYGTRDTSAFTTYKSTLLIICGVYILMLATVKGKAMQYLCIVLLLVQFVAGWNGIVAPDNMTLPECTDSIIVNSEKINKVREYTDQDRVSRIKDISNSLNAKSCYIKLDIWIKAGS
ncbi:MAG: YfhO family protein, partial [Acetatifactor sp.]|nr:YfhO family protein [Acetatifactor sp.]